MKIFFALTITLLANSVYSQDYIDMPLAVQQKMNENKQNGHSIFTNVYSDYEVILYGLKHSSVRLLKKSLQSDTRIVSFEISKDLSKLTAKAKGAFSIIDIKTHINKVNSSIEAYSSNYFVY